MKLLDFNPDFDDIDLEYYKTYNDEDANYTDFIEFINLTNERRKLFIQYSVGSVIDSTNLGLCCAKLGFNPTMYEIKSDKLMNYSQFTIFIIDQEQKISYTPKISKQMLDYFQFFGGNVIPKTTFINLISSSGELIPKEYVEEIVNKLFPGSELVKCDSLLSFILG